MVINPIVRVYIPIIRIPIKGGRSPIPNTMSLDPVTYIYSTWKGPEKIENSHRFDSMTLLVSWGDADIIS